jgi:hypothetical protein
MSPKQLSTGPLVVVAIIPIAMLLPLPASAMPIGPLQPTPSSETPSSNPHVSPKVIFDIVFALGKANTPSLPETLAHADRATRALLAHYRRLYMRCVQQVLHLVQWCP